MDAVFETDDVIDYEIGSGLYNAAFTDWLVSGNVCEVDMLYQVRETVSSV